jgi:aspartate kinase
MKSPIKVFKFGGASIKDAAGMRHVAEIIRSRRPKRLLVVVSALGKTTNALEDVIHAYFQQTGQAQNLYTALRQKHEAILHELVGDNPEATDALHDIFEEGNWVLEDAPQDSYDFIYDQLIGIGELASSCILAAYLNKAGVPTQWLDARNMLRTDDMYKEATVLWDETIEASKKEILPILDEEKVVLTQGFIGSTADNATTSLGREGSDYSAAIFSYCLDAESMTIWKDVPGVLTGDPRVFENVTQLFRLSYKEAIEMTYYGARVIHPKTIKPLQNKSIPLHVKSFINPDAQGTIIAPDVDDQYPPIVVLEKDQALLNISTKDFSFVAEHHLARLFDLFAKHRVWVNLMKNTAISFIVCMPYDDMRVPALVQELEADFNCVLDTGLELLTVRHAQRDMIDELRKGKLVMLEDSFENTVQMALKDAPMLRRKPDA